MKKPFRHGLIIGKFYPLHAGHSQLIRTALASCDRLTIQVFASSVESIPLDIRIKWIQTEHPMAVVQSAINDGAVDFSNESAWKQHLGVIKRLLDVPVDAVFTSDAYGEELSRRLNARWVRVDPERRGNPVSGTAVRADPEAYWWALSTSVREYLAQRVVILGAESTGSTTLTQQLAEQFEVPWVPEFGSEWSTIRPGGLWAPWHAAEFEFIVREQRHAEAAALRQTPKPLLICDTDMLATALRQERHLGPGERTQAMLRQAANHRPMLYLLSGDDILPAGNRAPEEDKIRRRTQQRFRDILASQSVPWLELRGTEEQRLGIAVTAVEEALAKAFDFHPPLAALNRDRRYRPNSSVRAVG